MTILAGQAGSFGNTDGPGSAARFNFPSCAVLDSAGNVYVAEVGNHTIRKVTPEGVVTTLAGLAGSNGSADGIGSAARFYAPFGVAVDSAGNAYVADTDNHTIRKVTPAGEVTTLAGSAGTFGSRDGTNRIARFNGPNGLVMNATGSIYVTDTFNHTIRKMTQVGTNWVVTTLAGSVGVVTTLAGVPNPMGNGGSANGTGSAAQFSFPRGLAVDTGGNLYVADTGNSTIRRIAPAGSVTTRAGSPGQAGSNDGIGAAARFNNPSGVAVDQATNIYVADTLNHTIRKITPRLWY
jgi:sugar lactone lactonase YvrE